MSYTPPPFDNANFSLLEYTPPAFDEVNFNFTGTVPQNFLGAFLIWGRIGDVGKPNLLGMNGIWQRRHTKTGIRSVKMKFYTPTNPQTIPQEANRSKFAAAMAAWGDLTDEEKAVYNKRAKRLSLYGRNLFVREYYSLNP